MDLNQRLTKRNRKTSLPAMIICIIAAVFLAVIGWFSSFEEPLDDLQMQTSADIAPGDWYEVQNLNYLIDSYASTDTSVRYIAVLSDNTMIGVNVPNGDEELCNQIVEETWAYLNEERDTYSDVSISGRGSIKEMDADEKGFYEDWFAEAGFTGEDIDGLLNYYYLDLTEGRAEKSSAIVFLVLALCFAALAVWLIIRTKSGSYKKKTLKEIESKGIHPEQVEADLQQGISFKYADIGRKYAIAYDRKYIFADLEDVIWVYPHTTVTRYTYMFIPVGKTKSYGIYLCMNDRRQIFVRAKKKEESDRMMQYLTEILPDAMFGFSDENAQTYNDIVTNYLTGTADASTSDIE